MPHAGAVTDITARGGLCFIHLDNAAPVPIESATLVNLARSLTEALIGSRISYGIADDGAIEWLEVERS